MDVEEQFSQQYLYGVEYAPKDLRLAVVEASPVFCACRTDRASV